jgi:hypothetical protein
MLCVCVCVCVCVYVLILVVSLSIQGGVSFHLLLNFLPVLRLVPFEGVPWSALHWSSEGVGK